MDFTLARPAETGVVVWWLLRVTGTEEMNDPWPELEVAVDVGVQFGGPDGLDLGGSTIAVRLDRSAPVRRLVELRQVVAEAVVAYPDGGEVSAQMDS